MKQVKPEIGASQRLISLWLKAGATGENGEIGGIEKIGGSRGSRRNGRNRGQPEAGQPLAEKPGSKQLKFTANYDRKDNRYKSLVQMS